MNEETPNPHVPHSPSLENFNKQPFGNLMFKIPPKLDSM